MLSSLTPRKAFELPEMTVEEVLRSCKEHDGYQTPELNDILYLHFKGFREIKNLEPFTAVKALYLESNGFTEVCCRVCFIWLQHAPFFDLHPWK